MSQERHQVTRIRRETRRRELVLVASKKLSRTMLRLSFGSDELVDFDSAAPDDHIKLFVPDGRDGVVSRDYTPRLFDKAAGSLVIDFALHDGGPATEWARHAVPGDVLTIGGPRGSSVVADDFDWYLLIGDETAIPSIGRRLGELRAKARTTAIMVVDGEADRVPFPARHDVRWVFRSAGVDDAAALIAAIGPGDLPEGDGYVWIAAEAQVARAVRAHLVDTLGHPKAWTKASGYWSRGKAGEHETIRD